MDRQRDLLGCCISARIELEYGYAPVGDYRARRAHHHRRSTQLNGSGARVSPGRTTTYRGTLMYAPSR